MHKNAQQPLAIRRLLSIAFAAVLVGLCGATAALAGEVKLAGTNEVPAVTSTATASADIVVAADHSVSGTIVTQGITPTMAHIHAGAAGQNGPVVVSLSPAGEGRFTVPAGTRLSDEQYNSYKAGGLYVNVHSASFPKGEIRGQLAP